MRSLIMVVCVALASQSFAQEVFRALPIDDEQNQRLDANDERLAALERSVTSLAKSVEKLAAHQSVQPVGKPVVQMASVQQPAKVVHQQPVIPSQPMSQYYTTEELRQQIYQHRPTLASHADDAYMARGSNVYSHLIGSPHGFTASQVNGLSVAEANVLHALAPGHKNLIFPRRSNTVRSYSRPMQSMAYIPQPAMPNCALNGTCNLQQPMMPDCALTGTCNLQQVQSQQSQKVQYRRKGGGLLGFGILGG